MKSWLLALAVLLGGAVSVSYADYIVIKYKLSADQLKGEQGQPGMTPPGAGGTGPGVGGTAGGGGAMPALGGAGGAGRLGGAYGGGPGNYPGAAGGAGMGAGLGGGQALGGAGGYGQQGAQGGEEEVQITPLYVIAVVELNKDLTRQNLYQITTYPNGKRYPLRISHKWGSTWLQESDNLAYTPILHGNSVEPTVVATFKKRSQDVHKGKPGPDELTPLAGWALSHGLINEFHKVMDEVVAAKADHPVAVGYLKVKKELEQPAAANPDVAAWKAKLGIDAYKAADNKGGHYTLLHNAGPNESPEVQGRLTRLENAFQSFYYWFALQERADRVKVPERRLLAILVGQQSEDKDFNRMYQLFGSPPLVSDGFYARRDNLVIFSSVPREESYESVRSLAQQNFKGKDINQLLQGRGQDYDDQTLALLLRALQEDNEAAAVSQEAPRQLLAAAGLLPRNVAIPQWTQFGMGSFFGTLPGSPWPTLGVPSASLLDNNNYLYTYQTWDKAGKLDNSKTALERVVTDHYFRVAKAAHNDPAEVLKARTLAWSLTYFLANKRLDNLLRYFQELSKLPRDLEFDDPVLLLTFARAFDLVDPRNPDRVDQSKLDALASDWHNYVRKTPLEVAEAIRQVHKLEIKAAPAAQGGQNPGVPGLGGAGGGPGNYPSGRPGGN
jgi:hypothetical protein